MDNVDDELDQRQQQDDQASAQEYGSELQATIAFGMDVQAFLAGDIGKRLKADALQQRHDLMEQYIRLDPDDPENKSQLREIRHMVDVLDLWDTFFKVYIQEGEAAQKQFLEAENSG